MTFGTVWRPLSKFTEELLRFESIPGNERVAQEWLLEQFERFGFETYEWTASADALASHPSFPSNPDRIRTADRPSVAGVVELGDPSVGPTIVFNGHIDAVPVERELWDSDPFDPTWDGDRLIARGAVDMKSGLTAAIFAAKQLAEESTDLDGRIVVESVAGEEEGGIGAAAAALENPYPFERDAAIIAEPTELQPVVAVEGSAMLQLELEGKSAHAATRWAGESVLPHFERIRQELRRLERRRANAVSHPRYEQYDNPWPIVIGRVEAGSWASTVPSSLTAELRVGVAPGETVSAVEEEVREAINRVAEDDEWLQSHPPTLKRFSVQFEAADVDPDDPIVTALVSAMERYGLSETSPTGVTYGADSRHYQNIGIPTVLFGPGSIEQPHFPNESVHWPNVERAHDLLVNTIRGFLEK